MPERIQLKRTKGWRMPENTVKVDRRTKWGNQYPITTTRGNAIGAFLYWLDVSCPGQELKEAARRELRGKNLACWCPLDKACHADVLLEIANGPPMRRNAALQATDTPQGVAGRPGSAGYTAGGNDECK